MCYKVINNIFSYYYIMKKFINETVKETFQKLLYGFGFGLGMNMAFNVSNDKTDPYKKKINFCVYDVVLSYFFF